MNRFTIMIVLAALLTASSVLAADETPTKSFDEAAATVDARLKAALAELAAVEKRIKDEEIPLMRRLNELENELSTLRQEAQKVSRTKSEATFNIAKLQEQLKAREAEQDGLSNLLSEYVRNFDSRVHIAELQRYTDALRTARDAPEANLSRLEVFNRQLDVLDLSMKRLDEVMNGVSFPAHALDSNGLVTKGTMLLVGPASLFRSDDGTKVGSIEQRPNSLEPTLVPFDDPATIEMASKTVASFSGQFPLDPTLGNAHKVANTQESLIEHIKKGGPVMYPIFVLAGLALLVVLYKVLAFLFIRGASPRRVRELFAAVIRGEKPAAIEAASRIAGPTGRMLRSGAEHLGEPPELVEEVMYETVLVTRLKLNRFLPFVAVSAAAAPLLGLLGTVTGIMNTFKLITVFGTGDVKTLSSGISEALITTEYGLIVAIPSLLIHALLSRRARAIIDQMEKNALAFMNHVGRFNAKQTAELEFRAAANAPLSDRALQQVRQMLLEVLGPVAKDRHLSHHSASIPATAPASAGPHSEG